MRLFTSRLVSLPLSSPAPTFVNLLAEAQVMGRVRLHLLWGSGASHLCSFCLCNTRSPLSSHFLACSFSTALSSASMVLSPHCNCDRICRFASHSPNPRL